jgi:hypothetical protein
MIQKKINALKVILASLDIDLEDEGLKYGMSFSLEKILESANNCDKIFLTETESVYLVRDSDGCQRWKKIDDCWYRQTKTERLFFLNQKNKRKLISELKDQNDIPLDLRGNIELDVTEYGVGTYPLELGIEGFTYPDMIEKGDRINIRLIAPFHLGHKITEIIK